MSPNILDILQHLSPQMRGGYSGIGKSYKVTKLYITRLYGSTVCYYEYISHQDQEFYLFGLLCENCEIITLDLKRRAAYTLLCHSESAVDAGISEFILNPSFTAIENVVKRITVYSNNVEQLIHQIDVPKVII